jgi:hypothetical protein
MIGVMDITEIDVVDKLRYKKGSSLTWAFFYLVE